MNNDYTRTAALITIGQIFEAAVHGYSQQVGLKVVNDALSTYRSGQGTAFSEAEMKMINFMGEKAKQRIVRGETDPRKSLREASDEAHRGSRY